MDHSLAIAANENLADEERQKKVKELLEALEETATSKFRFHGTRKVLNRKGAFMDTKSNVILPGRKPLPYSTYIRNIGNIKVPKVSLKSLGTAAAAAAAATNESRFLPNAATKLILDKSIKSMNLRRDLFVPIEIPRMSEWIARQKKYIEELSQKEKDILNSYTSHGDVIVNGYCRGTLKDIKDLLLASLSRDLSIPLAHSLHDQYETYRNKITLPPRPEMLDEEGDLDMEVIKVIFSTNIDFFSNPKNIMTLLEQYKQDLIRIIEAAPKLTHDIVVYRGIKSEEHLSGSHFQNNDFLSTTIDPFSVLEFTTKFTEPGVAKVYYCCVYELNISKNVPCLYLQYISTYGNEFEVLVPPDMDIQLDKKVHVKVKPSQRITKHAELLEPYFNEHVLVVRGNVKKPSIKKTTRKNTYARSAAGFSRKNVGKFNLSAFNEKYSVDYNNDNNNNFDNIDNDY